MSGIEKELEGFIQRQGLSVSEKPLAGEGIATKAGVAKGTSTILSKVNSPFIIGHTLHDVAVVEEFKKLRSTLLRITKKDGHRNTIMVTSSESGEGKTTFTINLALVLAQEFNHTVLLIDADVRRPMIQHYLGLESKLGLTDCLDEGIDVGRAIIKTAIPKLSILSAGKKTDIPAELLSSVRMKMLVQELKQRYHDRYIIIDTPPALLFSETHVINTFVDGTLFVVKEGMELSHVQHALELLKDGLLLGFIYTNASPEQQSGRFHHYYDHYYKQEKLNK